MLTINTYKGGRLRSLNLYDQLLPSGKYCHQLPGPDLFRELKKLGLPVDKSHGWMQLATIYANHLEDKKEATQ